MFSGTFDIIMEHPHVNVLMNIVKAPWEHSRINVLRKIVKAPRNIHVSMFSGTF